MIGETSKRILDGKAPVPKAHTIRHAEHDIRVYSIGWLCYMSKAAAVTIRLWERQQVLPRPIFAIDDYRWYTALEVRHYAAAILNHFRDPEKSNDKLRSVLSSAHVAIRKKYKDLRPGGTPEPSLLMLAEEAKLQLMMKSKRRERVKQEREMFCAALNTITNETQKN